jgi:oligoendopeptidase F
MWDLSAPPPDFNVPRFTIQQASGTIEQALSPLGPDYGKQLHELLDPANRRLDIAGGENRAGGGFSLGFTGFRSVFFSSSFNGYYNDVRVLTHESTHAIHRELMSQNGVSPVYADGPHYFFESFAIFSELLWADYLYQHATDPQTKLYYLEQFFDGKGMEIFFAAQDASLEQAIYDGVKSKTISNADDLDAVTEKTLSRFSIWPARHPQLKSQWISMRLMYEDPLYLVNYMYASLLSLQYYQMYKKDPGNFIPKYIALMQNGFDAPPSVLLARLNINLDDPALIQKGVSLLQEKVSEYAALAGQ